MNLLELINIKVSYRSTLNDLILKLNNNSLSDNIGLSKSLNEIEETLDLLLLFERAINKEYHNNYISKTESIADVYTYIDGLSEKINILDGLLLAAKKNKRSTNHRSGLDFKSALQSMERYKILRSSLLGKVRDVCKKIIIKDLKL